MKLAAGPHTLEIAVTRFQPRNDRQGDTRAGVQGVLVDAVSVRTGPEPTPPPGQPARSWPAENTVAFDPGALPSLDSVAGPWVPTRTLACYPSLASFHGVLRSTKELGGVQQFYLAGVGTCDKAINTFQIDGKTVFCDDSRWYPYRLLGRSQVGPLDVEADTRMVFADQGLLTQIRLTNRSDSPVKRTLAVVLDPDHGPARSDASSVVVADSLPRTYGFSVAPTALVTTNGGTTAQWSVELPAHESREINYTMGIDRTVAQSEQRTHGWSSDFPANFAAAKADWEKRWREVFTPGNPTYSGCLPVLETGDQSLRELYYLSVASVLETERDDVLGVKRCFVTASPEWCNDQLWFWDESLMAQVYALLDPAVLKTELRRWLTLDHTRGNHIQLPSGELSGQWYAVNAYAYIQTLNAYLTTTKDFDFLSEAINGKTVLAHMNDIALEWKGRVPVGGQLEDYGPNSWALLEAPPDYKHAVASFNAANVWIMRQVAEYDDRAGDAARAAALRREADHLLPAVLGLYDAHTGSWSAQYPDGRRIDSRHSYDFLTVGTCISHDLPEATQTGMLAFLDRELMTATWMRAMSRQDPSALDSDRSDHGPAGAYSAWPAVATQAVAEFGRYGKALDMFHRFRRAFTAAIPQAIELTKVAGQEEVQARVSERAGASFAVCSGSYAQVVMNTFFGFRPSPDGHTALWRPEAARGFTGKLRHVRWGSGLYTIASGEDGITIEDESLPAPNAPVSKAADLGPRITKLDADAAQINHGNQPY